MFKQTFDSKNNLGSTIINTKDFNIQINNIINSNSVGILEKLYRLRIDNSLNKEEKQNKLNKITRDYLK